MYNTFTFFTFRCISVKPLLGDHIVSKWQQKMTLWQRGHFVSKQSRFQLWRMSSTRHLLLLKHQLKANVSPIQQHLHFHSIIRYLDCVVGSYSRESLIHNILSGQRLKPVWRYCINAEIASNPFESWPYHGSRRYKGNFTGIWRDLLLDHCWT